MALTLAAAQNHVARWTDRLRGSPRQASWPRYLFHTAHVTTAVDILRSRAIVCRSRLGRVEHDVANQGALHAKVEPHDYARLYFRPRNGFHLRTEGIKCREDPYRLRDQISVPIVFALDAVSVLTSADVGFSAGNLQKKKWRVEHDESFFSTIPFDRVYDDAPAGGRESVDLKDRRMAEVVLPGELSLAPHLRWILCRTDLDRRTLLHRLGADAPAFRRQILVEPVFRSIFVHLGLYLRRADWNEGTLRLDLHPPWPEPGDGTYEVVLINRALGTEGSARAGDADTYTLEVPRALRSVRITEIRPSAGNCWEIHLEKALAFHAPLPADTSVLA